MLKLGTEALEQVLALVARTPPHESSHHALEAGLQEIGFGADDAKAADSFLHGIHILRYRYSGTTAEFLQAIRPSLVEIGNDVDADENAVDGLIEFLNQYVGQPSSQQRHAKEVALAMDVPARLADATIISDIRPIILGEEMEDLDAAILMNTLRLQVLEDGKSVTRYFALSADARNSLQAALDRLEKKEKLLKEKYGDLLVEDSGHAD